MGDGCTSGPPLRVWLPMADPSPVLLPDLSIFLPASEKMSAVPDKSGAAVCGLPPAPGPRAAALPELLLSVSIAALFVVPGAFLSFLLVKSNFQMQEWNICRKVLDSAVTERPEAALMEERMIPHSIFPSPLAPVYKHINSRWMIKSPVFLLLFFFIVPSRHFVLCFQ